MGVRVTNRMKALIPMGIPKYVRVYDNGGETADRYTVVYSGNYTRRTNGQHQYVGMSETPNHPQGFCQHGESSRMIDRDSNGNWPPTYGRKNHLGTRIRFHQLPEDCQKIVIEDYIDFWDLPHDRTWWYYNEMKAKRTE